MFKTPQKRSYASGASTPHSTSKKPPLKGLFQDGIWNCDCNPRLPASHFQVKKEGPNKGRWFYTCQESKGGGCSFFLWDDDAVGREMRAVMGNTRSEQDEAKVPSDASKDKRTLEEHAAASNKFKADMARAEDDEFGDWSLSPEEERRLVKIVEQEDASLLESPRKAAKTDQYATPSMKRKREEESLPTPSTRNAKMDGDISSTPLSRFHGSERFGLRSPSNTPTPSRFRESTDTSDSVVERHGPNYDITSEVMELLDGQKIDEEVIEGLGKLLNRQALQISGIVKGRDITRSALKDKDAKIVELQQKITTLETEREMDKTITRHFKSDMAHSFEKRRGRGRGKT